MKKLIALAAVAACGAALAVESANIVGYQTFATTKNTYQLKSVQFDGISKTFNINDLSGDLTGPAWDPDNYFTATAPILQVRNGNVYDWYYFLSDGKYDAATGVYSPGWADAGGNPLSEDGVEIPAGTAFWLVDQQSDSSALTTAGSVPSEQSIDITFQEGYTLAACPYPKAVSFSEITFAGLTGPAWDPDNYFTDTAPVLQIRNGSVYDWYYFLSDGKYDSATGTYSAGWADAGGNPLPDYAEKLIAAGTAFWMVLPQGSSSVTATFTK